MSFKDILRLYPEFDSISDLVPLPIKIIRLFIRGIVALMMTAFLVASALFALFLLFYLWITVYLIETQGFLVTHPIELGMIASGVANVLLVIGLLDKLLRWAFKDY